MDALQSKAVSQNMFVQAVQWSLLVACALLRSLVLALWILGVGGESRVRLLPMNPGVNAGKGASSWTLDIMLLLMDGLESLEPGLLLMSCSTPKDVVKPAVLR